MSRWEELQVEAEALLMSATAETCPEVLAWAAGVRWRCSALSIQVLAGPAKGWGMSWAGGMLRDTADGLHYRQWRVDADGFQLADVPLDLDADIVRVVQVRWRQVAKLVDVERLTVELCTEINEAEEARGRAYSSREGRDEADERSMEAAARVWDRLRPVTMPDGAGGAVARQYEGVTYVIPCSGEKADRVAPARGLYMGSMFRHTLAAALRLVAEHEAEGQSARVLILSAKHGLVELDQVLEPYDQKMSKKSLAEVEALARQALALGIDWLSEVYAFLPRAYLRWLEGALGSVDVNVYDVYESVRGYRSDGSKADGIGPQRRINAQCAPATAVPSPADRPGLQVWHGADVNGLSWGLPVLVSYGRLREVKTLPVATAEWVCDSRGFAEIDQFGRWTISPEEYAADLRRYAREIGHMVWAAPQDWPAAPRCLERTGLTEEEHQRRTIESVVQLRSMAPDLPIICVVTGASVDGYLRHVEMYRQAGIDLRQEQLVVGVGALVGRAPSFAAAVIEALYEAGLTRLHGFGLKGPVLELVGWMLESIDSATWSLEQRLARQACAHGLVKLEQNCPEAARIWGDQQRERAAGSVPVLDLSEEPRFEQLLLELFAAADGYVAAV